MRNNTLALLILTTSVFELIGCNVGLTSQVLIINNKLTPSHVRFKGTKTSLIPPDGYKWDKIYSQYITPNQEFIRVTEIQGKRFDSQAFSLNSVDSSREVVLERHDVIVQSYEGVLLFSSSLYDSVFNYGILVFGDSTFTTMISAKYSKNNAKLQIEQMLKSVVYQFDLKIYAFEKALFSIDLSNTEFKFSNTITNSYTYTPHGSENAYLNTEIPRIDIIQYDKLNTVGDIQHMVNTMFTSYLNAGYTLYSMKSTSYNNGQIDCYESIAYGKKGTNNNVIYILLLHGSEFTLIYHGMSYAEHDKYLNIFKNTSKTLRFK